MLEKTQNTTRAAHKDSQSIPKIYEEKILLAKKYGLDKEKLKEMLKNIFLSRSLDDSEISKKLLQSHLRNRRPF